MGPPSCLFHSTVLQCVIVSAVDVVSPPNVALMFAVAVAATAVVVIVNVAVVLAAATVTVAGTTADVLELESATTMPPVGAAPVSRTVPVELVPPCTLFGETVTDVRPMIVSVSEMDFPWNTPVMLGFAV